VRQLGTSATIWPVVTAPGDRWSWVWSSRWNENWQGKPKYLEKHCPSATLSTTKPKRPDLGSNSGRRGGKPPELWHGLLFHASLLLGLFFDAEEGGDTSIDFQRTARFVPQKIGLSENWICRLDGVSKPIDVGKLSASRTGRFIPGDIAPPVSVFTRGWTKCVAVAVTLQTCIREVLGLNLGRNTGYPDRVFLSPSNKLPRYCLD
jgi:hypothetical protein